MGAWKVIFARVWGLQPPVAPLPPALYTYGSVDRIVSVCQEKNQSAVFSIICWYNDHTLYLSEIVDEHYET